MTTSNEQQELSLLTMRDNQVTWDNDQKKALIDVLRVKQATDADLAVFWHMCRRTQLDPFRRQIYMIMRLEWNPDTKTKEPRQTYQTGIDGYRVIAERAAAAQGVKLKKARFEYWDDEGNQSSAWWKVEPPAMIRASVQLGDEEPVIWDARFSEYVPLKDEYADDTWVDGKKVRGEKTGRRVPQGMWASRPTAQLEKCAEAGALRRACPEDLSNLWVHEEMERAGDIPPTQKEVIDGEVVEGAAGRRDWMAEIAAAEDQDTLRAIWRDSAAAGEKSPAVMAAIKARGEAIAPTPEPEGPQETADLPTEQDEDAAAQAEADEATSPPTEDNPSDDGEDPLMYLCGQCGAPKGSAHDDDCPNKGE